MLVWHRRLGLFAAAFLVLLVVTGVLINHAPDFGLDRVHLKNGWITDQYGLDPKGPPVGFEAGDRWLIVIGETLFLDREPIADQVTGPRGAVAAGSMLAFAQADALLLLTEAGELIERLGPDALPGPIDAVGLARDGAVAIRSGGVAFHGDEALLVWSADGGDGVAWSQATHPPDALIEGVLAHYRGPGIPASRLLADIHSGHVLGSWGPWLVDGLAIVFLALAATGLLNWVRGRR